MPFYLFYNCVSDSYYRINQADNPYRIYEETSPSSLKKLVVRNSTNIGKDIGGKLVLMDAYLRLGIKSDYILLMHDKQSPYHSNSLQWRKDLFRICEKKNQEKIFRLLNENPGIGIIASQNAIRNELDNDQRSDAYINSSTIATLKNRYGIKPGTLQYVAGTIFWVRATLFEDFFRQYTPLQIRRELESGNITDQKGPTYTHTWERLLCWVVTSNGHEIKGV